MTLGRVILPDPSHQIQQIQERTEPCGWRERIAVVLRLLHGRHRAKICKPLWLWPNRNTRRESTHVDLSDSGPPLYNSKQVNRVVRTVLEGT